MKTFSCMWSEKLGAALKAAISKPYPMSLVGEDAEACQECVNEGIDSHLEACYVPERGDRFNWTPGKIISGVSSGARLECLVSPESLVVLIRRLLESSNENGASLASGICSTLDIELI
jgi:hypothetical protein